MGRAHYPCLCDPGPYSTCFQDCPRFDAENVSPRGVAKSVMDEHGHAVPTDDRPVSHETPVSLEQQLAVWDRFADRAYELALDSMAMECHRVMALARARLIDGYAAYGDAMFTATPERLHQDALEEHADAVNYAVARMWQAERPS